MPQETDARIVIDRRLREAGWDIEDKNQVATEESTKTQVLFLGYVIDALKPNGRAGIILPEGTFFGTNRDGKEIRHYLLENTELQAVISMPGGVFQPYSGVKTSVLIFKKKAIPKLNPEEKIWFYNMLGDGSSLTVAKKFGPQYRNDIPDIRLKFLQRKISEQSWLTPVKEIIENDYILSANVYNSNIGQEEIKHREPKMILREIEDGEENLQKQFKEIKKLIGRK